MIRDYNCGPIRRYADWDPIFGLGTLTRSLKSVREHKLLENFRKRLEETGANTILLNHTGQDVISTIEPENLKTIQAVEFKKWSVGSRRIQIFTEFLGPGIFSTDGAAWAHSREMLRPNFVRSQVGDLDTFEVHVGHLINALPRDGSTVNLQKLFFQLTIDSATEFLFGESTNCLAPGIGGNRHAAEFAEAFDRGQEAVSLRARMGILSYLLPKRQYQSDTKKVHGTLSKPSAHSSKNPFSLSLLQSSNPPLGAHQLTPALAFVDSFVNLAFARHRSGKTSSSRYIFADALVAQHPTPTPLQIRSELLNILLAGRDTTASLLSNVLHTLARHPSILARLYAEVESTFGYTGKPTYEGLKGMKFLRAVLNESLRVHPVVPINSRQAVEDTVLPVGGGEDGRKAVFVKKGMVVNWSSWAMQRREDYYGADADVFRPGRWIDGDGEGGREGDGRDGRGGKGLRPGWEYLPFNGGARICLGRKLLSLAF